MPRKKEHGKHYDIYWNPLGRKSDTKRHMKIGSSMDRTSAIHGSRHRLDEEHNKPPRNIERFSHEVIHRGQDIMDSASKMFMKWTTPKKKKK